MSGRKNAYKPVRLSTIHLAILTGYFIASEVSPCPAINIICTFNSGSSEFPFFDPTGSRLIAMMGHVENYWENIIEYSGTLNVSFYYDDLDDGNGVLADHLNQGTSGGKPTDCRIRVDWTSGGSERAWYFDPTPMDNGEYDMQQTLVRDLTAAQRASYYNGSPHDLLEVNYWGTARADAPSAAKTAHDLFSVLLHEMGHGLGMTGNIASGETEDNDYDFDPDLVWGQTCAAVTAAADNPYHLEAANALMVPSIGSGRRRLPSATDIFAIEAASNWGDGNIDLRRQDFFDRAGNEDWNTARNWAGNQKPSWNDDAFARCGGYISLSATAYAKNLLVAEDTSVLVGSHKLDVTQILSIGRGTEYASVSVTSGGEVEADQIEVADGAYLTIMSGGTVDTNRLEIKNGGTVSGIGRIDVADYFSNEGIVRTGVLFAEGNLTIRADAAGGILDLDGHSGNGVVRAQRGDLRVEGRLSDSFSTTFDLGRASGGSKIGYEVTFTEGWALAHNGHLNMTGSGGDPASVEGGPSLIEGYLDVDGNNCRFGDAVTFASTAQVTLDDSDDVLYLYGATTYQGGSFTGNGRIIQNGDAAVMKPTAINVRQYDMDGISGTTALSINDHLTLNLEYIDLGNNLFDGTLSVNNPGRLIVNTPGGWKMNGTLNLNQNGLANQFYVTGSDIGIGGQVNVDGLAGIGATIDLSGTIELGSAGDMIQLGSANHANRISGGAINGPGTVTGGAGTLTGYGAIGATVQFNNANLRAQAGVLNVTGTITTVKELGTADDTGVLNVAGAWNTNVATSALRLNGGAVTGGSIDNGGLITGHGEVKPSAFYNHGTVKASGGTLVLNPSGSCDLDGIRPDGIGLLDATAGSIHVKKAYPSEVAFNGDLSIGKGHEFRMDSRGLRNMSGPDRGMIAFSGGKYVAPALLQGGSLSVDIAAARLESVTTFVSTGDNTIESVLELAGDTSIEAGATFTGSGLLSTMPGTTLTIEDGAVIGVDLLSGGRLENGSSPGRFTVTGNLLNKGTIEMELGGNNPATEYDTIAVKGLAALGGTLEIDMIGRFRPGIGERFTVMEFGSVNGNFTEYDGLIWGRIGLYPIFSSHELVLCAGLAGDLNGDGYVGSADLDIVRGAWNKRTSAGDLPAGDPSGDGRVGSGDLDIVRAGWGNGSPPSAVPEPGALVGPLFAFALLAIPRCRG